MKLECLVLVVVVGGKDVGEEDVGALATEFEGDGDKVLRRVLHDQATGGGLTGERDLLDTRAGRERLSGLDAEAVDDVENTGRQQVTDDADEVQDRDWRLLGRLEHDGITGSEGGGKLPHGHEDREVPRNDLADYAERLVKVVRHGVGVDLRERTFLCANSSREVSEVIDGERNVGVEGLADRLAVVPRLGECDGFEVLLHTISDLVQDDRALGDRGLAPPGRSCCVRCVESEFDVFCGGTSHITEILSGHRCRVLEVLTLDRSNPFVADPVVVSRLEGHDRVGGTWAGVHGHCKLLCKRVLPGRTHQIGDCNPTPPGGGV